MSGGHRSGRSTGRVSCKSTELKRCSMIEMRWNKYYYYYKKTERQRQNVWTSCGNGRDVHGSFSLDQPTPELTTSAERWRGIKVDAAALLLPSGLTSPAPPVYPGCCRPRRLIKGG